MKTGVKFTFPNGNKLQVIKALREATGMDLKGAKDVSEAGWCDVPAGQIRQVLKALQPACSTLHAVTGDDANAHMGLERVSGVLYRVAGRCLNRVADLLERVEARYFE